MKIRTIRVVSRYSPEEAEAMDAARGKLARGTHQRLAALGQSKAAVPEINREAWASLGKALSNLNQIARAHNSQAVQAEANELANELRRLRLFITGLVP